MSKKRLLAVVMAALVTVSTVVTPVSAETLSPDVSSVINEGIELYTEEMCSDFTETNVDEEMSFAEEVSESEGTEAESTEITSKEESIEVLTEENLSVTEEAETEEMESAEGEPVTLTAADVTLSGGTITKYIGTYADYTDIIIPSEIGGVTITAIGNRAFYSKRIGAVVLPETLTRIEKEAFQEASLGSTKELSKIIIPGSVKKIGERAFYKCQYLGEVEFEDVDVPDLTGISFGIEASWDGISGTSSLFCDCPNLKRIKLSNNIKNLPGTLAGGCKELETVEWGENIETIGNGAFKNDSKLSNGDLTGTKVTKIGFKSFEGCKSLHNVKFPNTLTNIDKEAYLFAGLGTSIQTEKLLIPGSVKKIGERAFYKCQYLGEVEFEDVDVPDLTGISFGIEGSWDGISGTSSLFCDCPNLKKIKLSNNIKKLPGTLAGGCKELVTVEWGENIETIGNGAFKNDSKLSNGDLTGTKVTKIGFKSFEGCKSLHNVKFPNTIKEIDKEAYLFAGLGTSTATETIIIPGSIEKIGHRAFVESDYLGAFMIEDAAEPWLVGGGIEFEEDIVSKCKNLKSICLSNNVVTISSRFAVNCPKLVSIVIPANVVTIKDNAFGFDNYMSGKISTAVDGDSAAIGTYDWSKDYRIVKQSYKVIFESNNGSGVSTSQSIVCGTTDALNANAFVYAGYKFTGWNTNQDGTGKSYANRASVKDLAGARGSITLYAQWTPMKYNLVLDSDGGLLGKAAKKTIVIEYAKKYGDLSTYVPVRKGYTFEGWFTEPEGKGGAHAWDTESVTATPYTILYAYWKPIKYEVCFDANAEGAVPNKLKTGKGVTVDVATGQVYNADGVLCSTTGDSTFGVAMEYGEYVFLTGDEYIRNGYSISSWNTKPNGKGKKYSNAETMPLSVEKVVLYAQWKKINYKITYNLDGGKNSSRNPKQYRIDSNEITLQTPTKTGFTFVGWKNSNNETITTIPSGSYGDRVLTAVWKENEYTINYHGASDFTAVTDVYTPGKIAYTELVDMIEATNHFVATDDYKDAKSIVAWTTKEKGRGTKYNLTKRYSKLSKIDDAVIDLYAVWGNKSYTIGYSLDGGTNNNNNPFYYTYSSKNAVAIKAPKKTGYLFEKWKPSGEASESFASNKISKGAKGNLVLSANWIPVAYTVKLNKNNSKAVLSANAITRYVDVKYNDTTKSFESSKIVSNEWYDLVGWNTKANGKGTYARVDEMGNVYLDGLSTKNGGTITLYAQWRVHSHSISYVNISPRMEYNPLDSYNTQLRGVVNKNARTYNQNARKVLSKPTCTGYVFLGWYTDKECTNKITAIAAGTSGDMTLYSKWRKK